MVQKFGGYRHKTEITNIPEDITDKAGNTALTGYLVTGSQNVIITDSDKISVRGGYALDGVAYSGSQVSDPIVSSADFFTSIGGETHLRVHNPTGSTNGVIEFRYVDSLGNVTWNTLMNSTLNSTWDGSTLTFNFAEYWDTSELLAELLFVNGDGSVYMWTGATATFASATSNTLTCQGSKTWAELGFLASASGRFVVINGTKYTYTGGESSTTLTGVTPDPTGGSYAAGTVIVQGVLNYANNSAITGLPAAFKQDLIATSNNQVYYGWTKSRQIYISKANNFKDVSFTAGVLRVPGEGGLLYLDACTVGFAVGESPSQNQNQNDIVYIDAGKDFTYQVVFTLSQSLANETIVVRRLQTSPSSAAISQAVIAKIKNAIVKISNEPTFDSYANLEKVITPKSLPISDPIKTDFLAYNFANAHVLFYQSNIYITVPVEGLLLIYNLAKGYWEAPQILPVRRLSIIGGKLYGHSSQVGETYQLFSGTNDNGNPINAIAAFPYQSYGSRFTLKNFNEIYTEGYLSSNTTLTVNVLFEYGGAKRSWSAIIKGNDLKIQFSPTIDPSLGKNQLGGDSIGTTSVPTGTLNKFRQIDKVVKTNFFESQIVFQTNEVDQMWEIIGFGPAVVPAGQDPVYIKK